MRAAFWLPAATAVFIVAITVAVGVGVRNVADAATREFPGDRVAALLAYADSSSHTLSERNRAVWALGQLGDSRALPILEKSLSGGECRHDRELCQYELTKAIRLCSGGRNVSALFWRPDSMH